MGVKKDVVDPEKARRERERKEFKEAQELETLKRAFKRIDRDQDGKIGPDDIIAELDFLAHRIREPEAKKIIWEVDDDADGFVDWDEFREMFNRVRDDTTGYEPRKLFNIVEFCMLDKNHHGSVDLDEAVTVLYKKYGREAVDARVAETIADDETDKIIKYSQYVDIQRYASKARHGSVLKPGATMVPHVKGLSTLE